ncbi:MAG: glycosyltransferase family 39 protein [Candidatus Woesebacteria bacterium]
MITSFFILVLAFLLRLPLLSGSFWLDEAAQALESIRPLSAQLQIVDDFQPPLFHLIVHFFSLVSHQEWWLRMPSMIAGIATIWILYRLLLEKFGKKTAIIGSLLLATSPFHIFYSQELRPYALATFFATLSWYILVSETIKKRRWTWYTVVSTLGMYTMYLYPFLIASQIVYIWFEQRKKIKFVVFSQTIVALLFLPWLPTFLLQLQAGTTLTQSLPGWSLAVATPQLKALPLILAKFFVGQVPFHGHPFFILSTAMILLLTAWLCLQSVRNPKLKLFWYWLIIPLLGSWIVSFFIPIIQAKRVMLGLPALLGIISLERKKLWKVIVILVFLLQGVSLFLYYTDQNIQRENWRVVTSQIEMQSPENAAVLFSFRQPFAPWTWYEDKKIPVIVTGKIRIDQATDLSSVSSQLDSVSIVYLFDYLTDLTDPAHQLQATLNDRGFEQIALIDGKQVGFVRIFKKL